MVPIPKKNSDEPKDAYCAGKLNQKIAYSDNSCFSDIPLSSECMTQFSSATFDNSVGSSEDGQSNCKIDCSERMQIGSNQGIPDFSSSSSLEYKKIMPGVPLHIPNDTSSLSLTMQLISPKVSHLRGESLETGGKLLKKKLPKMDKLIHVSKMLQGGSESSLGSSSGSVIFRRYTDSASSSSSRSSTREGDYSKNVQNILVVMMKRGMLVKQIQLVW